MLKAAADAGKFGIGVNSDQDNLFPGHVLTSTLKQVDIATYKSFKAAKNGTWKGGVEVFGLKKGGVDFASGRMEQVDPVARGPEGRRRRESRHHFGQDHRPRLYVGQQVPCVRSVCA